MLLGGGLKAAVDGRHRPLRRRSRWRSPTRRSATICVAAGASVESRLCLPAGAARIRRRRAADIVLIDDGARGGDAALLPAVVRNLRYVRVPPRGSAAGGAATRWRRRRAARCSAFLAPQVRVTPGWLDELAAHLRARAATPPRSAEGGARRRAAASHRHPAGRRTAGCAIPAGSPRPTIPEHDFLRPVHGLGDVAFARPPRQAGRGRRFRRGYAGPAHAVFDLCMRLRARGGGALPAGRASPPGPTTAPPRRRRCPTRACRTRIRAGCASAGWRGAGAPPAPAAAASPAMRWSSTLPPRPDHDAGSVATLEQMLLLRRARLPGDVRGGQRREAGAAEAAALRRNGIELAAPPHYRLGHRISGGHGAGLDLVHVHRHANAHAVPRPGPRTGAAGQAGVLARRPALPPRGPRGRAGRPRPPPDASRGAGARTASARSDATILISDYEIELLRRWSIPRSCSCCAGSRVRCPSARGFAARSGALLPRQFPPSDPNVDGVHWFVAEVLPLVRARRCRSCACIVAGSDMPDRSALWRPTMSRCSAGCRPGDLFGQVRLSVAPLRYGAGFKGKVATSLAHGVPVVGSTTALEGTGLAPGDGFAVADDPAAFARAIVRLHEDEAVWTAAGRARALARCAAPHSPPRRRLGRSTAGLLGRPRRCRCRHGIPAGAGQSGSVTQELRAVGGEVDRARRRVAGIEGADQRRRGAAAAR